MDPRHPHNRPHRPHHHAPPPPVTHHVHHAPHHHHTPPPPPPAVTHVVHHTAPAPPPTQPYPPLPPSLATRPSVRVFTKARTDYSLTIRHGRVILAPNNHADLHQHWIKDEKYSNRVKDDEGLPAFALINKATGQAIKHSTAATTPVQLIPYNDNHLDESILWTEKHLGDSYKAIRMVNNVRLNLDALNGDKQHGGVFDGTQIVVWEWKAGDNQRWQIVPY